MRVPRADVALSISAVVFVLLGIGVARACTPDDANSVNPTAVVRAPVGLTVRAESAAVAPNGAREIAPLALVPVPKQVELVTEEDLPPGLKAELETAVGLTARYFEQTGSTPVPAMTIVAYRDLQSLTAEVRAREGESTSTTIGNDAWWSGHSGAYLNGSVYLYLGGVEHSESYEGARSYARVQLAETVSHEMAHALHGSLAGPPKQEPAWLVEGITGVESATMLEAFGLGDFEEKHREALAAARAFRVELNDSSTENRSAYPLGFLAVEQLTEDGDIGRLRTFSEQLGKLGEWDKAFEVAFGQPVDEFLREFREYRIAQFPPYAGELRGQVRADQNSAQTFNVWACEETTGDCQWARTDTDGSFVVGVPDGRYRLQVQPVDGGAPWFYALGPATSAPAEAALIPVFGNVVEGLTLEVPDDRQEMRAPE